MSQILFWFDGPQIVLLSAIDERYLIAVAVDEAFGEQRYIGSLVSKQQLADYQAGRFDLRFLMSKPAYRKWYVFDWPQDGVNAFLEQVESDNQTLIRNLPDAGLFSRDHDPIDSVKTLAPTKVERFEIDGSWDLSEFSAFYNKLENIYYIFHTIDRINDSSLSAGSKQKLVERFEKPFIGGGSYKSAYDQIANDNDPSARLMVSGIQYNSPGHVKVKARLEPFEDMIALLKDFATDGSAVRRAYSDLDRYLGASKLKRANKSTYLSEVAAGRIEELTRALAAELNHLDYHAILKLSGDSILVCAKVMLSIYRRTERLFEFFAQGRVSYSHLEVTSEELLAD